MAPATANQSRDSVAETLRSLAGRYPPAFIQSQLDDVSRIAFHIELVNKLTAVEHPVVADIGGGLGLFSPGCAAVGMDITLVDDFRDDINETGTGASALDLHRELGVKIVSQDVTQGLSFPRDHFDAITCFDSMEHWHNSPKKMFHGLIDSLRPGGWFILGVPNCVNLRKRITVPLGHGKWTPMKHWYEPEVFRSHVREPDVDDLHYIARDLGLRETKIIGRNWLGFRRPGMRAIMPVVDSVLRIRPSLCANIYLVGRK